MAAGADVVVAGAECFDVAGAAGAGAVDAVAAEI